MSETRQQVLIMSTYDKYGAGGLRSEAWGWSAEDGWEAAPYVGMNRPVGLMGYFRGPYSYPTPYHALGDGWRLLAPPEKFEENGVPSLYWWFVRDVPRSGQ